MTAAWICIGVGAVGLALVIAFFVEKKSAISATRDASRSGPQ